jgi:hypothetical protein
MMQSQGFGRSSNHPPDRLIRRVIWLTLRTFLEITVAAGVVPYIAAFIVMACQMASTCLRYLVVASALVGGHSAVS